MPFRRRRPVVRRRKTNRPRKMRTNMNRQVHKFKRQAFLGTYKATSTNLGGLTPVSKGFSFQLVDLPNVAEYTSLFDQYKITGVQLRIIPKSSEQIQGSTSGTVATTGYGQVVTAIDYDDAGNPASKDQLLEYGSVKVTQSNRVHTRFISPKILNVVFRNALTSGYSPVKATYLDCSYNDLPHYGIKLWIDAPSSAGTSDSAISYDVYAMYYFTCKNTR